MEKQSSVTQHIKRKRKTNKKMIYGPSPVTPPTPTSPRTPEFEPQPSIYGQLQYEFGQIVTANPKKPKFMSGVNKHNDSASPRHLKFSIRCLCSNLLRLLSIRTVLIVLFLIHALITIGCSWLLLFYVGQRAIDKSGTVQRQQIQTNTRTLVSQYLHWGPFIMDDIGKRIVEPRRDMLLGNYVNMGQFLISMKDTFKKSGMGTDYYLYYANGNEDRNDFVMVDNKGRVAIQNSSYTNQLYYYLVNNDTGLIDPLVVIGEESSLDIPQQTWYQKVKQTGSNNIWFSVSANMLWDVSTSILYPVNNGSNIFNGDMFGLQVPLSSISSFLANLTTVQSTNSKVFIMTRTGLLVASSFDINDHQQTESQINLLNLSGNKLISSVAKLSMAQLSDSNRSIRKRVSSGEGIFHAEASVLAENNEFDWILIVLVKHDKMWNAIFNSSVVVIIVSCLSFVFGTIAVLGVTQAITSPLYKIKKELMRVSQFSIKSDLFKRRSPFYEIRGIQDSVVAVTLSLSSFQKYVPSLVVGRIIKEQQPARLGMHEENISLYFSDIVDFTNLSESSMNDPGRLLQVLGEYFEEMTDVIEKETGLIDKFIGDAIMAIFMDPQKHHLCACQAAYRCQKRLSELRNSWRDRGMPELKVRIGINSGRALVGNMGSRSRLNFTAIGDTVNTASRLEALNKPYGTDILIGQETYDHVKDYFLCEYVSFVAVKGKDQPLKVYRIVCERSEASQIMLTRQEYLMKAHDAFFGYSFKQAIHWCESLKSLPLTSYEGNRDVLKYDFVDMIISAAEDCIRRNVQINESLHTIMTEK